MKHLPVLLAACVLAGPALAQQDYPNRPMRMVIPWPPGQATDLVGRVIALRLSELLGYQVVADNRAGAGGMIGTDIVAKAAPDGYTLLAASSGPVTIAPLLQKTTYVSARDLAPVAIAGLAAFVLVTAPSFPAKDIKEFIALAKNNPGKYTYASSGTGASAHLAVEYFNGVAGIKGTHVPYKGSVPALTDVISGQVTYMTETVSATMPHIRSGKLRAYGISSLKPSGLAPGIPTYAAAADMPGFEFVAWIGVMVAAGTPKAVDKVLQTQDARDKLGSVGLDVNYLRAEEMGRYLYKQSAQVAEIIKKANIKVE
jgi:tripartite-type tricarboxylate transporter receptor subunit TctC